ncbi:MAG: alpha/beta hydrolase [Planctomycetota bacterium]|jgi:acetyl esterase/lipase
MRPYAPFALLTLIAIAIAAASCILPAGEIEKPPATNGTDKESSADGKKEKPEKPGKPEPAQEPEIRPEPKIHRNISYIKESKRKDPLRCLDIYTIENASELPVMVNIHGGGWSIGDKKRTHKKPEFFQKEGFILVSINYRLSPKVVHPVHVQDVAEAVVWVHDNINKYGGDPDRIFVMGHSAGAHLAALVSTDDRRLKAMGKSLKIIKGAILLDGAGYDIPKIVELRGVLSNIYKTAFGTDPEDLLDASPIIHVAAGKDIPPFLIIHAGKRVLSEIQSKSLAEALKKAGSKAFVRAAPGKNHGSLNRDLGGKNDKPTKSVKEFLDKFRDKEKGAE